MTADTIEAVLLWEDAWLSARVLFLGMYVLICFRQLAQGRCLSSGCSMQASAVPANAAVTWCASECALLLILSADLRRRNASYQNGCALVCTIT